MILELLITDKLDNYPFAKQIITHLIASHNSLPGKELDLFGCGITGPA